MMNIAENLRKVREEIAAACARSGRSPEEVTLIAVSKTKPVTMIEEAIQAGAVDFGENKPQELRDKVDVLGNNHLRWHLIGHLQRNKVKYVISRACMIHSVDSLRLGEAISQEAVKHGLVMPVLVEVNIAGEDTKFGVSPEDAPALVEQLAALPGLSVRGLMTIAPYVENACDNRVHFRNLRDLSIDIASKNIDNVTMCELSMGMTGDYTVAVEEGATLVRVGTGIFGERNYQIGDNT